MNVCLDEQHCTAHRVKLHQIAFFTHVVQMFPASIAPCIQIVTFTAMLSHAIRLDDLLTRTQKGLYNIRWVLDDIHIQPQHPVYIFQRPEQQMIRV